MSTGLKANNDGSAAIQVGGTDYIQISSTGNVTIPQSQTISGNLTVTGTATVGGQPVGGNYILQRYTSPSTWDATAKKAAGLKAIKVTVVGAGGNGGTATSLAPASSPGGAGGGGGGTAIEYVPVSNITPGSKTVTAGPGTNSFGPWGTATPNSPTATATATAGSAGSNATPATPGPTVTGGAGGAGSGGTINFVGMAGNNCGATGGYINNNVGGAGGSSAIFNNGMFLGGYGPGVVPGPNSSIVGGGGGGAGGRPNTNAGTSPGGTGSPGIIIIEEFY